MKLKNPFNTGSLRHIKFFNSLFHMTQYTKQQLRGSKASENFQLQRTKTAGISNCTGDNPYNGRMEEIQMQLHLLLPIQLPELTVKLK